MSFIDDDPSVMYRFNALNGNSRAYVGRIEESLNPKYVRRNTIYNPKKGFYTKLFPQFPQLQNERTKALEKELKNPKLTLLDLIKSPLEIKSLDDLVGIGVLFIIIGLIINLFEF